MSFVDMPAEKPIPDNERFLEICQEYGLRAARVANALPKKTSGLIMIDEPFEAFMQLMVDLKADVLLYHYSYYDIQDYLITEETVEDIDIELSDKEKASLMKKAEDYNTDLQANIDFTKPDRFFIAGLLRNGRIVCFEAEDKWMTPHDEAGIIQVLAQESQIALLRLIYPSDRDYIAYQFDTMMRDQNKMEKIRKELFEHIINEPKFKLCTTQSQRHRYAVSIQESNLSVVEDLIEVRPARWKLIIEELVETTWKLFKSGHMTYDDFVKKVL
ncbi:MAG: hypothetical protein IKI21_11240 [Oscillospiraceae bacterium]|nr:hypothetical protein [Oscillospiraceae bacterium]